MLMQDLQRHIGKFYGKYSGDVVDNQDETMRGLIKVRVPAVFGATLEVQARPCLPAGHFFVPPPGAKVWIEFEGGEPEHPIWVGTWYPDGSTPEDAKLDPPDNRVIHTPSGHTIKISDKDGQESISIRHKSNSFIAIDDKGSIVISNKNGSHVFLNVEGGEATVMSEHGHLISMTGQGLVLSNSDGAALDIAGDTVRITAANIILDGTKVALGHGADGPTIKASEFSMLWSLFQNHTHPSAMGPTGTPLPPTPLVPAQHFSAAVLVK